MTEELTTLPEPKAAIPLLTESMGDGFEAAGTDGAAQVSPSAPLADAQEEFVTIPTYNSEKDVYENVQVRLADLTARKMLDREVEMRDANDLDTETYDQNYHYYWANKDSAHPSYNEARRKGYAPVRKSHAHMHQVRKLEGLGEVVTLGDLVLMQVPKMLYEQQESRRLHARAMEREDMMGNAHHHTLMGMVDGDRVKLLSEEHGFQVQSFDENGQPIPSDPGSQFRGQMRQMVESADYDRAGMMAESLDAARKYAGLNTTTTFGGFGGPMGGGIPESPYNRQK